MKLNASHFVVIACVAIMAYLLIADALSKEVFFVLAAIMVAALVLGSMQRKVITLEEAIFIAREFIKRQQKIGDIPMGTVYVEGEELKDIILIAPKAPTVTPDRFLLKARVEPDHYYLVKVSLYGSMQACTSIRIPGAFDIDKVPERKAKASLIRVEDAGAHDDNMMQQRSDDNE
jgi:hypothetical protein